MAGVSSLTWLDTNHPWGTCFLSGGYDGKVHTWQLEADVETFQFWKPAVPSLK